VRIGELNELIRAQTQERQRLIERETTSELDGLRRSLREQLSDVLQHIERDTVSQVVSQQRALRGLLIESMDALRETQAQIERRSRAVRRWAWLWTLAPVGAAALITLAAAAAWGGYQAELDGLRREIAASRATLDELRRHGGSIRLSRCGGRLCAQIDEAAPPYQSGYRVLRER